MLMGYGEYLKSLLRPLRLYDLDDPIGSAELNAMGSAMDELYTQLSEVERESILSTAQNWGLERYEDILPYHPVSGSLEERRAAIMAMLRIDGASFTLPAIRDTIAACGIAVEVEESTAFQTVCISFPGVMGEPKDYEAIQSRIAQILPCHLAVEYLLKYLTWMDLENYKLTWRKIESTALTWDALEIYSKEV